MQTPSRYLSLKNLLKLAASNYISTTGREYSKFEVDKLIIEKKQKQSEVQAIDAYRSRHFWSTRRPSQRHGDVTPADIVRASTIMKGISK